MESSNLKTIKLYSLEMYEKVRLKYLTDEYIKIGVDSMTRLGLIKLATSKYSMDDKIGYLVMKGQTQKALDYFDNKNKGVDRK